ncbi:MAG: hypothetical protein ABMA14_19950 [Hyphomonadaceae bacterium]
MQEQQKRSRAEATFGFGETELSYAFRYGASVHETVADYFEIAPARKFITQHDWSAFRFGALVSLLGLTAMAAQTFITASPALGALWVTPGLVLLALFAFRPDHFRVFQASGNPVWIIEDNKSHAIIAEIDLRRRNRLAEIFGPLNLCNEPHLEIGKIEWLFLESVLTREEADNQIAQVKAAVAEKAATAEMPTAVPQMFAREAISL